MSARKLKPTKTPPHRRQKANVGYGNILSNSPLAQKLFNPTAANPKTQTEVGKLPSSAISNGGIEPAKDNSLTTRGKGQGTLVASLRKKFMQPNTVNVGVRRTNIKGRSTQSEALGTRNARGPLTHESLESPLPKVLLEVLPEVPEPSKLPTDQPHPVKDAPGINTIITGVLSAKNTATEVSKATSTITQSVVDSAMEKAGSAASNVNKTLSLVLPIRTIASSNASNAANLIRALNLAGNTTTTKPSKKVASGQSKEEGNKTTSNANFTQLLAARKKTTNASSRINFPTPNAPPNAPPEAQKKEGAQSIEGAPEQAIKTTTPVAAENPYMTLANVRNGLPTAKRGLPIGLNLDSNILAIRKEEGLNSSSRKTTRLSKSIQGLNQLNRESSTNTPLTKRERKHKQVKAKKVPTELPFKPNNTNIPALVQARGLRPTTHNGINIAPNSIGFVAKYAPKRVGKKTMKKIIYNSTQKQILLRKIKKAEAAARRGPSFFNKVLGGLGFNSGDGRDPKQYIDTLQAKINKLDNNIAKGETRLANKREVAQNNATKKNVKAKQKAITRTKHYRDLLSQHIHGYQTGEIDVSHTQKNTHKIEVIKKQRDENKKTKTNILATEGNTRANGLGENMRSLFNSKNKPLVRTMNQTSNATKSKATANAMNNKNKYTLLGLNSKTSVPEDSTPPKLKQVQSTELILNTANTPVITSKQSRTPHNILGISPGATDTQTTYESTSASATTPESNLPKLLALSEPKPTQYTPIGTGNSFINHINKPNYDGALLFG